MSDYSNNITLESVINALGGNSDDTFFYLIDNFIDGNIKEVVSILDSIYNSGEDLRLFLDNFISFCLNVEKYIIFNDISVTIFPSTHKNRLDKISKFSNPIDYYMYLVKKLLDTKQLIRLDTDIKSTITIKFIEITRCQ